MFFLLEIPKINNCQNGTVYIQNNIPYHPVENNIKKKKIYKLYVYTHTHTH